jgi:hypothetical protein
MGKITMLLLLLMFGCEADTVIDPETENGATTPEEMNFTTPLANSTFVYFSFSKGDTVMLADRYGSPNWDVGFLRTTVIVNGGTSGPGNAAAVWFEGKNFEDVVEVPDSLVFAQDDTAGIGFAIPPGSDSGWYTYTAEPNHWILAIPDRVFVFRTADGKYAKVKFLSYYSTGEPPTEPQQGGTRYYTFKYVYQPNGTKNFE